MSDISPEEEQEYLEYLEWKERHERRRKKFHEDGIPVGYGIPDNISQEKEKQARNQLEEAQMEDEMNEAALMNEIMSGGGYTPPYAPTDKAKIIDFINRQVPIEYKYIRDEDGNIVEKQVKSGEIPPEVMFAGGLYAYYNHTATMSNLDDQEVKEHHSNLRILRMSTEMSMPRNKYTPEMMSMMDGAEFQLQLRVNQNKYGQERYLSAAEIHEENKRFGLGQRSGRLRNAWSAIKGEGK